MKKNHHKNQYKRLHLRRISWFGFLFFSLFLIQLVYNFQTGKGVLAYATNINHADLLSQTNIHRGNNGLAGLGMNSKLNSAAQAKAQHMIDNDYWAHTSPDGVTPWYWFDYFGYDYVNAGENLAYGFSTSASTVQAWMDSPGHRANILGNYLEVGFGIANGANYQGGQYTVVVAMYATPNGAAESSPPPAAPAPPAPPPPAPAAPTQTNPPPPSTPEPTPAETPAPAEPEPEKPPEPESLPTPAPVQNAPDESKRITSVQSALTGKGAWPFYLSIVAVVATAVGFFVTHVQMLSLAWHNGMRFAGLHPMFDAAALGAVMLFLLTATVGYIK